MFGKKPFIISLFRKAEPQIPNDFVREQTSRSELKDNTEKLSERTVESHQKMNFVTDSQKGDNSDAHEDQSHRHHSRRKDVRKSKRKSSLWQSVMIGSGIVVFFSVFLTVFGLYAENKTFSETARIVFVYSLLTGLLIIGMTFRTGIRNLRLAILTGIYLLMYIFTLFLYYFNISLPGPFAFAIMSLVVIAASVTAMKLKNQLFIQLFQIFAHVVPLFLLEGMEKAELFLGYIAAINLPVLLIAVGQKWKDLIKTSFLLVWLISIVWIVYLHEYNLSFITLLLCISLFFLLFYGYFFLYQLYNHSKLTSFQRNLFIANLLIYYVSAISILIVVNGKVPAANYTYLLALFLLLTCLLTYAVTFLRKHMFSLLFSLFMLMLACSIYFLLSEHMAAVFILAGSCLLLFYARSRKEKYYEKTAYILFLFSFLVLVFASVKTYGLLPFFKPSYNFILFFNYKFLLSLLYVMLAGFLYRFSLNSRYPSLISRPRYFPKIIPNFLLIILMLALYISFSAEIAGYWDKLYTASVVSIVNEGSDYPILYSNSDLLKFKFLSVISFTFLFLSLVTLYLLKKFRNNHLAFVNLMVNGLVVALYLTFGFMQTVMLRDSFLNQDMAEYFYRGHAHIIIKYITLVCVLLLMFVSYRYSLLRIWKKHYRMLFELLFFAVLLLIVISEWLYLARIVGAQNVFGTQLTLSILLYAAFLLLYGFIRKKIHLRIAAVVLLTLSLVKFLVLDLQFITPFVQTVLFITLGISLIIISLVIVIRNEHQRAGRGRRR